MKTKKFEDSMDKIKKKLEEEDKVRDELLSIQRKTIRICSEAIKSIHRKEFKTSDKKIEEAAENINHMSRIVKGLASLECWRGLTDASQELGEAIIFGSIVRFDEIPSVDECKITWNSYMLAHCDVIGELRRYLLDSLKNRDFENAQRAFEYMEYLYSELMTVDYTKMLVGPLRSKLDVGRNLVNRSRTDLINAMQAFELKDSMEKLTKKLDNFKKKIE
jgi:translin